MKKIRPKIYFMSKSQIAKLYGVATRTLTSWIKRNKALYENLLYLKYSRSDKIFTPAQILIIFQYIGTPDEYDFSEDKRIYYPVKAYRKGEMLELYRTTHPTFIKILERFPQTNSIKRDDKNRKYYTALDTQIIFEHLGHPFYIKS